MGRSAGNPSQFRTKSRWAGLRGIGGSSILRKPFQGVSGFSRTPRRPVGGPELPPDDRDPPPSRVRRRRKGWMGESRHSSRAAAAPEGDAELEALRRRIDAIDREILERLNARAAVVCEVGGLKAATGTPVYASTRERAIVEELTATNPGPFPNAGIAPVFREIISASRSLEAPLRVAYLGPRGTFSHEAARLRFGDGTELADAATIADVFALVERGVASLGVVPVENTTEGGQTGGYPPSSARCVAPQSPRYEPGMGADFCVECNRGTGAGSAWVLREPRCDGRMVLCDEPDRWPPAVQRTGYAALGA